MYYRFLIKKDNQTSGIFHPKQKWNIPKENGLYDIVRKNFANLGYTKNFKEKSESWFKEKGLSAFKTGIDELTAFYEKFGVMVIKQEKESLKNIIDEDEYQVWCLKN